jgi:amino acid adenylation domain-containing protein
MNAPSANVFETDVAPAPGNGPTEVLGPVEALRELWAEVLEMPEADLDDDFFELGGDSLSAVQLLSRVYERFLVNISLTEFFNGPTIRQLGSRIHGCHAKPAAPDLPGERARKDRWPATTSQRQLHFMDTLIPERQAYNIYRLAHIRGDLDPARLGAALEALAARHDALRTFFDVDQGVPSLRVSPSGPVAFPIDDLTLLLADQRVAAAQAQAAAEAARPFELSAPPLWRARLWRIGSGEFLFLVVMHHTIGDGWSMGVFFRDLSALCAGEELGPLPITFVTTAERHDAWRRSDDFREHLAAWTAALASPPPDLRLPISKPRPKQQTFRGAVHRFEFPEALVPAMDEVGRQLGATRFMIAVAALNAVLHRYTAADDVLVGTPVANRTRTELEPLIGFFANSLVLRTNLAGEPTFAELIQRVRATTLAAFGRAETPLEAIVDELKLPRDASRQPLFQVMFVYQNMAGLPSEFAGCVLSALPLHNGTSIFDMRFVLEDKPNGGLHAWIEYNTDLFECGAIESFAGHFLTLLDDACRTPETPIARLPLLNSTEYKRIVCEWNATAGEYPRQDCIHDAFERQARQKPDDVAVIASGRELTFGEINARANRLARFLRARGVGAGTFVGICLKRSEEMIVSVLAVLKSGGAYIPLDPAYPRDRVGFMLSDTRAALVITQSALLDRLPRDASEYVCIDRVGNELLALDANDLERNCGPDDLAYVIFTSGSTGKPKGVMLRHQPALNTLDWVNTTFGVGPSDRLLFVTSLSFDLSVYDIFGALGAGASVRVASDDELRDPAKLLTILRTEPITIWDSAPAALQQLVPFFFSAQAVVDYERLRLVMLSGDWIPVPLPDQVRARFPKARVVSLGGATEAAIWTNWYPVEKVDPSWPSIPYGKPIRNARYHILDKYLQPVPMGVPGELHIGGEVLADGYLNRLELTAERFIPDPFAGRGDGGAESRIARLYKTGDLARYFSDGNIEFLGRIDSQVKVRGFRVEIGEIEAVLAQHPQVREAAVKAHKDADGTVFLVAYVVRTDGSSNADELARHLQERLPDYMVPAQFALLEALPITPNGKVDRGALQPPPKNSRERRSFEPPADDTEATIAEVWRRVLGVERIGRTDNFFELGGHSLKAVQVVALLQERFNVDLRLPTLFLHPTLAGLAAEVRQSAAAVPTILRQDTNRAPASPIQQRFWFLDRALPDKAVYNVANTVRLSGPLDVAALQHGWQAVVNRQEALRTTFDDEDGRPVQVVNPAITAVLPLIDLSELKAEAREAEARRLSAADAAAPFDLKTGPLWRVWLVRLAESEHLFCWTIHHVILDESSLSVMLHDLWTAYEAAIRGSNAELPDLPIRYLDYSVWQRGQLNDQEIGYWKERLKGAPPPLVPPHPKPRPAMRSYQGEAITFDIPPDLVSALATAGRRAGVTPFITYLAALKVFLLRLTGQCHICVGAPVSARPAQAVTDVLGCFVNTLVLRTDLNGDPKFGELLARVRDTLAGAVEHPDVPFEKLIEELKPERIPGGHPLFQTFFVYQGEELRGAAPGGISWQLDRTDRVGAKFDITLTVEDRPGRVQATFEYSTELYDDETIRRFVERFMTLLRGIGANADAKLSELPVMTERELGLVLHRFNATAADYPRNICVHQLVEAQVARAPNATAFEFNGQPLTFRELSEKANRLAHHLRTLGVGPETLVGICVERSLDMPVAMLGVLKSGGAYVPLDPDFPADRLAFYVRDSKMPVVVTQDRLVNRLSADGCRFVCLDRDAESIAQHSSANPENLTRPEELAYVLYTSGSTGRPNGVAIPHRALVNLLLSVQREPGLSAADTILSLTTLSFDIHTVETWLPMISGARSVIVPREVALDGHRLAELLDRVNATVMQSTPATWRLLLAADWNGKKDLRAFSGGEPLTHELIEQLSQRTAMLENMYGPTETTVYSVNHKVAPDDQLVLIGKPIANTQVYILDPQSRLPMPIGCVGEIYIGGDGLARGYLGRDELTAARFVHWSFSDTRDPIPDTRIYKTGDLGRFLPDGSIECLGRVDHQVKIRGFRIELNEIERVLEENNAVAQAVVVARGSSFAAMLHAYYRSENGQVPTPADLRQWLRGRLPDYMIPATFTALDAFPQTPNGKVDRKALPEPSADAAARATERIRVAPANDAERALVALWEEVLGVKPIGATDDFHELGGHSLLAAVLMSRIETRLGHRIPIEALFQHPTVRGLADVIQRKLELGSGVVVPLQTTGTQPPLFLIAGAGGHVFAFHKFARLLGPDFPAYGMKAIGVDGSEPPPDRFEEIAARYVKEMLALCPDGPYIVGGYSVGGRIALEVALQLQGMGKSVPRIVIFDMHAPGSPRTLPWRRRFLYHVRNFMRLPLREKSTWVIDRLRNIRSRVRRRLKLDHLEAPEVEGLDIVPQTILRNVWGALVRGMRHYWPRGIYAGQVVLIRSTLHEDWHDTVYPDPLKGWDRWSTHPVATRDIAAGHLELFNDEHQEELAAIVREAIATGASEDQPCLVIAARPR